MSVVLHRDESTPHIHAAVVPIVTGERLRSKKRIPDKPGKKKYRKKSGCQSVVDVDSGGCEADMNFRAYARREGQI